MRKTIHTNRMCLDCANQHETSEMYSLTLDDGQEIFGCKKCGLGDIVVDTIPSAPSDPDPDMGIFARDCYIDKRYKVISLEERFDCCHNCIGNYQKFFDCKDKKQGWGEPNCYHKRVMGWGFSYYPSIPEQITETNRTTKSEFPYKLGIDYEYRGKRMIVKRKSMEKCL